MRPTPILLALAGLWLLWALGLAAARLLGLPTDLAVTGWWLGGGALLLVAVLDARRTGGLQHLHVRRQLPGSLALGVAATATLRIDNLTHRRLSLTLSEPPSPALAIADMPLRLVLPPGSGRCVDYTVQPERRGDTTLGPVVARIDSRWRLWQHRFTLGEATPLKVYPNFAPIVYLADVGMERHMRQLGIHLAQRRGDGLAFKQLRDFIEGDALRQIDWKATARRRKPISREYQEERDQDVFFLLDCGRRLRHRDDTLSHFDHALNALLLTAYIAIRQGDAAGFCSFAGPERWLSPVKGNAGINLLLNKLYDLDSTARDSDFLQLAESFAGRHRKRSLVVIISNIREEDCDDLVHAVQILSRQHVVVVASLREQLFDDALHRPVEAFQQALYYTATHRLLAERRQVMQRLAASGVSIVDATPQQLHIRLANEYLRLKRSQRL